MPKGQPTSSTERMRLQRLRREGVADPVKTCSVCGKSLKKGAGQNLAWNAGLCYQHWIQTPEGKQHRRKSQIKAELWGVAFFGGEPPEFFTSIKKALKASTNKGGRDNHPVFVVWSDGRVTSHCCLTARSAVGLKPEDGDEMLDGFEEFRDQVPQEKRNWF